jgi:hypothetical protein
VSAPTRFFLPGGQTRCYRTDRADRAYPGVTSILGRTNGAKAEAALRSWQEKNPGARDAAANRGTNLHAAVEAYVRGRKIESLEDEEHRAFWHPNLERLLDVYEGLVWSERPLRHDWAFTRAADGISRVWSHRHRYAGCPDIIGTLAGGLYTLDDVKSSTTPYCRYYPRTKDRSLFTGWRKFQKAAMQIAAYAIASQETLDIRINQGRIIVLQAGEKPQCFTLHGEELAQYKQRWLQRVRQYWELVEIEEGMTPDEATTSPAHAFWENARSQTGVPA